MALNPIKSDNMADPAPEVPIPGHPDITYIPNDNVLQFVVTKLGSGSDNSSSSSDSDSYWISSLNGSVPSSNSSSSSDDSFSGIIEGVVVHGYIPESRIRAMESGLDGSSSDDNSSSDESTSSVSSSEKSQSSSQTSSSAETGKTEKLSLETLKDSLTFLETILNKIINKEELTEADKQALEEKKNNCPILKALNENGECPIC